MHRLLLILCLLVAGSGSALARRIETSYVTVTEARAVSDGRSVAIDLSIDNRSWNWMRDRNIKPVLTVWFDGRRSELDIRGSRDTIVVRIPGRRRDRDLSELRIAVTGKGPRGTAASMMVGNIEVYEITIKVASGEIPMDGGPGPAPGPGPGPMPGPNPGPMPPPPAPAPPPAPTPNWAANPAVIKACGDTMVGSTSQQECLDAVRPYTWAPEPMIRACARVMTGSSSTLQCIRSGGTSRNNAVGALEACGRAMVGSTSTLQCLDSAVRSYSEPSAAITACGKAMVGSTNALACIAIVVDARTDPTPTINSCRDAMTGDTAVLGCLKRAFAPR